MAEKNFAITPSVNINRSKFLRTSHHKTTFNLGDIVPIYVDEVLPGDTRSIDFASLVRMSTPIAPIMDDIELELFAFFVPNRLCWSHWKEFMGENSSGAGARTTSLTIPQCPYTGLGTKGRVGDYMGLPVGASIGSMTDLSVSELPLRAYFLIYNRWFRNQNLTAPVSLYLGDLSQIGAGYSKTYNSSLEKACKKADYFTKALPYAQKGLPVSLPLGDFASVKVLPDAALSTTGIQSGQTFTIKNAAALNTSTGPVNLHVSTTGFSVGSASGDSGLIADLSTATASTINQLREAFAVQKALEKDALYGTRYWEILYGHFGVRAPDASLQDPEYLGGHRIMINVDQVLQTSETSTTALGTTGANSVTGGKGSLFTKSFVEHGWLMVMAVARQSKHTYSQGINRMWSRTGRYDFYWPVFANLGAQDIKIKELDIFGSSRETLFGYQEAWAEYRYKPSICTSDLRPGVSNGMDFWTLTDYYSTQPTLSDSFVKETRDNLARALVTGVTGPDFIADFYFQDTAVRPMPLYSIPGLIDHH